MPTETNLPTKCLLFLELSDRLIRMIDGIDTNAPENKIVLASIDTALGLAFKELENWKDDCE